MGVTGNMAEIDVSKTNTRFVQLVSPHILLVLFNKAIILIFANIMVKVRFAFFASYRKSVLESAVITCLVEILKTSPPNLQRKASSILEFIIIIDPSMDTVTSVDIASGLDAVFHQKVLKGTENNFFTIKTLRFPSDPI